MKRETGKRTGISGDIGLIRVIIVAALAIGNVAIAIVLMALVTHVGSYMNAVFTSISLFIVLRRMITMRATDNTLAWALILLCVPVAGIVLYLSWGRISFSKNEKGFLEKSHRSGLEALQKVTCQLPALKERDAALGRQASVLTNVGFPLYNGDDIQYFPVGERLFESMFADLEAAQHHILLSYYIINRGQIWSRIFDILCAKAAKGVSVRVMYDDFGCVRTLDSNFARQLRDKGIQVAVFNPIHRYVRQLYMNYRNHQKMCVVDGRIAYVGGVNLADEYANIDAKFGHWKDTGLRLTGAPVRSIAITFLRMWEIVTEKESDDYTSFLPMQQPTNSTSFVLPFADGPANNPLNPALDVYCTMCATAQQTIWYTTPYLTPNGGMREILCLAARSGVDVRIITPGIPDYKTVYAATRGHYKILLESGVRIFEYAPGFMHAKMAICDRKSAVVGSINMDSRSFFQHYENAVWVTGDTVVEDIAKDFEAVFAQCREIDRQIWATRPAMQRFREATMCLFSPLL